MAFPKTLTFRHLFAFFMVLLICFLVESEYTSSEVSAATYQVQWVSHNTPAQVNPNQTIIAGINFTIKNTSDFTWQTENSDANPIRLSYHWVNQAGQTVVWDGARSGIPGGDVPSGATVSVPASVVAPPIPGYYTLYWDLVQEGIAWFSWQGSPQAAFTVYVVPPYGVSWQSHGTPTIMYGGQVFQNVPITIRNTGGMTWVNSGPNAVHLSYHWVDQAGRIIVWDGARSGLPGNIAPGQTTTFLGSVVAPPTPGYYTLYWDLVQEGMTWFSQQGCQSQALTVHVGGFHHVFLSIPGAHYSDFGLLGFFSDAYPSSAYPLGVNLVALTTDDEIGLYYTFLTPAGSRCWSLGFGVYGFSYIIFGYVTVSILNQATQQWEEAGDAYDGTFSWVVGEPHKYVDPNGAIHVEVLAIGPEDYELRDVFASITYIN